MYVNDEEREREQEKKSIDCFVQRRKTRKRPDFELDYTRKKSLYSQTISSKLLM